MSSSGSWVVDTNLLISRLLVPNPVPAKAVQAAMEEGDLLVSDATSAAPVAIHPRMNTEVS